MGTCSRCGRKGHIEYGYDGLPYCSSCIFYGRNRPCWRCRMYLPISELQQYEGQWLCPYCLREERDKDLRQARAASMERKKRYTSAIVKSETCERCGRTLSTVYVWNGRKLCKSCLDEEKKKWDIVSGKPSSSPYRMKIGGKKKPKGLIERLVGFLLSLIGIKRKKEVSEIVVVKDMKKVAPLPEFGKPLVSGAMEEEKKNPKTEGIMKSGKKRKKKK